MENLERSVRLLQLLPSARFGLLRRLHLRRRRRTELYPYDVPQHYIGINGSLRNYRACGYLVHRAQTVISFCKNVTLERTFIALTILPILILSLLDCHIFLIFPTVVYACLLAVFDKSQDKTPNTEAEVESVSVEKETEQEV